MSSVFLFMHSTNFIDLIYSNLLQVHNSCINRFVELFVNHVDSLILEINNAIGRLAFTKSNLKFPSVDQQFQIIDQQASEAEWIEGCKVGTTFVNIQVRDIPVSELERILPGTIVKNLSDGWTTVLSENFQFGSIENTARQLSKKIDKAVLSIEYYDDDMLMMTLYRGGKTATRHITDNGYGCMKKAGNSNAFLEHLQFSVSEAPYFKEILKCEDLGKKMQLLQKFFGVALWIDHRMIAEKGERAFRYHRDLRSVQEYRNETKKLNEIKNQTKLNLLMEFEGALIEKLGDHRYLIGKPPYDGNVNRYMEEHIFMFSPSGFLTPLFDARSFGYDKYKSHCLIAAHNRVSFYGSDYSIFDDQGNLLRKSSLNGALLNPLISFKDGSFIAIKYGGYGKNETLAEYDPDCTIRWKLEFGRLLTYPKLHNNFLYLHYEDQSRGKAEVVKISRNGDIVASFQLLPYGGVPWMIIDDEGGVNCCSSVYENDRTVAKLVRLTENLEPVAEIYVGLGSFQGFIDNNKKITLITHEKEIIVIDCVANKIYCRRKYEELANILTIDSHGRIIVLKGSNTIEIFDSCLELISRHRVKGTIFDSFKNETGHICLLTGTGGAHEEGGAKKMILRTYEIVG